MSILVSAMRPERCFYYVLNDNLSAALNHPNEWVEHVIGEGSCF